MEKETFEQLCSQEYNIAYKTLKDILKTGKLNDTDFEIILSIENKLIIGDFLIEYNYFDKKNLEYMEKYIIKNLDSINKLFISDLIEFATYWDINIPYENCINFLSRFEEDDSYVQLASIDYIFMNFKFLYIEKIKKSLDYILQNPNQNISSQIKAAFFLFRITMNKKYLTDLIYLIGIDNQNKELLRNILKSEWNKKEYFDFSSLLKTLSIANPAVKSKKPCK